MNDLSLEFLIQRVIKSEREDITAIEDCAQHLAVDAEAKALYQEALGMAKGHLETLEEIAREAKSADSGNAPAES